MSIALSQKLASISDKQVFAELNRMLPYAKVSISWSGREISIPKYSGTVPIYTIGKMYLLAALKRDSLNNATKKPCDRLWIVIQSLYKDSDIELKKTWVYKYVIPLFCTTSVEQTLRGPQEKMLPTLQILTKMVERDDVHAKDIL
jgi:hypothetical protein